MSRSDGLPQEPRELHVSLGRNVRARRVALGMTLEALEASCGVSATFIGQIERGVKKASLETLARLAGGLDAAPHELLGAAESRRDGEESERRLAALLRGHAAHERAFLYSALRHLSRKLRALARPRRAA